jgi:hypothetical protein
MGYNADHENIRRLQQERDELRWSRHDISVSPDDEFGEHYSRHHSKHRRSRRRPMHKLRQYNEE